MNELIYKNYMTEAERASYIENKKLEDEFTKLNILYEMTCLQQQIHRIDVEAHILESNGTYDDYGILMMEADQQVAEQKRSILGSIFEWFAKVFDSISNAIKSIFTSKANPNDTMEVNSMFVNPQFNQMFDSVINMIKSNILPIIGTAAISALSSIFKEGIGQGIDKIVNFMKTNFAQSKLVKVPVAKGKEIIKKMQDGLGTITQFVNGTNNKNIDENNQADTDEAKGFLKKLGEFVTNAINGTIKSVSDAISKAKPANQNNQNNQQNTQNAGNDNKANNQSAQQPAQNNNPAPANPAPAQQPAQPAAAPANNAPTGQESVAATEITDNELSVYESVFGKMEEEPKNDDISDLLALI